MSESKSKIFSYMVWIGLAVLVVWILFTIYINRGWSQEDSCLGWVDYGENNCTSGMYDNCTDLKINNNAWVKSCLCQGNENITGEIICPEKIKVWRFNK